MKGSVDLAFLEYQETIADDLKFTFVRDKFSDTWSWVPADEVNTLDSYHSGFGTRYEALHDAVGPYVEIDQEE